MNYISLRYYVLQEKFTLKTNKAYYNDITPSSKPESMELSLYFNFLFQSFYENNYVL